MIPNWLYSIPLDEISRAAHEYKVPRNILIAITAAETGPGVENGRYATRFESHYQYLYEARHFAEELGITRVTEEVHQRTSWGWMQMMGGVIRELGFGGHLPEIIVSDQIYFKYAAKKIKEIAGRWPDKTDIISAWNAGSPIRSIKGNGAGWYKNQPYVDKVSGYLRDLEKLK